MYYLDLRDAESKSFFLTIILETCKFGFSSLNVNKVINYFF